MMSIQRRINESLTAIIQNIQADVDQSIADADDARALAGFYLSLIAVLAVIVGLVAGYLTVSGVTGPIRAMARTAEALRAGDLSRRVDATQPGVLGTLATAFNEMATQIQRMVSSLEERVAARTRDLQIAAQVSEQAATILDPEQLLPQVAELTKTSFDLYHAHIYLVDENRQALVLAGGAGEAGRIMKQRGHRIAISARALVAQAAREKRPVVVDDVTRFEGYLPNPLLPNTRSEAAFPLAIGGRVLGVLDAQSDTVARFDADTQVVLSTLAGQIAVAAQNASLFAAVEQRGRRDRALSAITDEIQRATSLDEVLQVAARELGQALRVPHTAIELQLRDEWDANENRATGLEPDARISR
jgi:putative methionine-R-sulfoxide reductase with GAF domain